MAKGYIEDRRGGSSIGISTDPPNRPPPSRPARRIDSVRGRGDDGSSYRGGHYAESPVIVNMPPPGSSSDHHTLQASTLPRSSVQPLYLPNPTTTVAKVTRSRSLSSRPAGVAVFHTPDRRDSRSVIEVQNEQFRSQPPSRPNTRMSTKSRRSQATGITAASGASAHAQNTTKAGVVIETMSAPNPFCPNTRGVCCLMVLVNLALILVAIGFIIVLQLPEPKIVWNIGIVILASGFATFFVALLYCMCICQETRHPQTGKPASGELYWTHHWQKNITIPEIKSREKERWDEQDHFPEDDAVSDTSSRDYPKLYLESDYGQRTDREADFETEHETGAVEPHRGHRR